jgi:hypothetical protein
MFLRGLRSDLTTLCDCSTRCCRNISVATVITNAALFEQLLMSSSCEMIFLTRATNDMLNVCFVDGRGMYPDCNLSWAEGEYRQTYAAGTQCL